MVDMVVMADMAAAHATTVTVDSIFKVLK
jgi:hypothetical protein